MFTPQRRKFLSTLVADLGKLFAGIGALNQVFSKEPVWVNVAFASGITVILFVAAFFIHPPEG